MPLISDQSATKHQVRELSALTLSLKFGRSDGPKDDLKGLFDSIESIPWRRRQFERRAMLEEMLQRAGPAYKKHFLEKEASMQAVAERPTRRVSAITTKAVWLNHLKYFRIALAVGTCTACLVQAKVAVCAAGGSGKTFLECFSA